MIDPPAAGAWNMAVDEALLDEAAETELPTLRFYRWLRPTLSLGYFQKYADRDQHPPSLEADVVRRLSGGGAILHDREVTYCLTLPRSHPLARDTGQLYRAVHKVFLRVLSRLAPIEQSPWRLARCEQPSPPPQPNAEPFLCFARRSSGDILLRPAGKTETSAGYHDYKIVGSAQRRRRGAIMQHGSLLLSHSLLAPTLVGFNEIVDTDLAAKDVLEILPAEFGLQLDLDLQPAAQTIEHPTAQRLVESRYASSRWSMRR